MTLYSDGVEFFVYDGETLSNNKGVLVSIVNRVPREAKSLLGIELFYVGKL